jgi:hypothetical protein
MSLDSLTDFGILAHYGDDAVSGDAKKRSGLESSGRGLRRLRKDLGDRLEMKSDENTSTSDSGDAEKTAAIEERGLHRTSLLRAKVIADGRGGQHGWYCNAN